MRVNFLELQREWKYFESACMRAFKKFGRNGVYVLGPDVETFESQFAKFCGYTHAIGVSTGLSALEMALRAHQIGVGDEVITVPNSAVATSLAISHVGATPVFCDIGDDFLIDVRQIESLITPRTKCILPVHLFGKVCDMKYINALAKKHALIVIEDSCQAHGAHFVGDSCKNTKAFSFYPTKNLGAFGEGGAVVTNDIKIRDFVRSYRNYGQEGRYNHVIKGTNDRIDPLQCTLLSIKLKKLKYFVRMRRNIAKKYCRKLKNLAGIVLCEFDMNSAYHLFVIRVLDGKRDMLREYLKQHDIETLVHYPTSIPRQTCYAREYSDLHLERNDLLQTEIVSLSCHPFLKSKEQEYIIKHIHLFFEKNR